MKGELVPPKVERMNSILNVFMITANIIDPVIEGIAYFETNDKIFHGKDSESWFQLIAFSKMGVGLLQLVSGIYLMIGVLKIRKLINSGSSSEQINVAQLIQHFLAFSLYLLSVIVEYTFYAIFAFSSNKNPDQYFASVIVTQFFSFISQLCLCWILWHLASKEEAMQPASIEAKDRHDSISSHQSSPNVQIEDYDESSEVQARIWNQFIRKGFENEFILKKVDKNVNYTGGMISAALLSSASSVSGKNIYAKYTVGNVPTADDGGE